MKRYLKYIGVFVLSMMVFGICNAQDTYASYVDSASVSWQWTDWDDYAGDWGESYFRVSLDWGSDCGSDCEIDSGSYYFTCCGSSWQSEWSGSSSSISVWYSGPNGDYDYYGVQINPWSSDYQPVCGYIRKKKAIPKWTLSGISIDYDNYNTNLGSDPNSSTVESGNSASISRNTISGYSFLGWRDTRGGSYTQTGTSYSVSSLTSDKTVYPVYVRDRTLTITSINESGSSLSSISGLGDKTATVAYNTHAGITRGTAIGYTFLGWKNNTSDSSYTTTASTSSAVYVSGDASPKETFNVKNMTADKTSYAVYVRNEFAGRMTASGGIDTGWKETNDSKTSTIECANDGCTATFNPQLKTIKGAGKTQYSVERSKNGGSWSTVSTKPTTPFAPSTSGTEIKKTTGNYNEKLYPGEKVCYRIVFRPYGAYANDTTATEQACVNAKVSTFKGKVTVSGAISKNTGYQNSNYSQNFYINNCSPTAGCKVSFTHTMKRTDGTLGSSDWTVARTSNLVTSTRAITNNNLGSGTFNASEGNVKTDENLVLYPGMVVCEKLTFKPSNDVTKTVNDVYVRACASALGNAQPGDPDPDTPENPNDSSGDKSFLNIKVKNETLATKYQREVYAKPMDKLVYRSTYNPNLQYTYYLKPQKMQIDGGTIRENSGTVPPKNSTLATLFDYYKGCSDDNTQKCWKNAYTVFSANFAASVGQFNEDYVFTKGSAIKQADKVNDHVVQGSEVGRSLNETAKTNKNSKGKITPSQVIFTNNNDSNLANVITTSIERTAYARIPYNFINTTEVTTSTSEVLYAGESKTFDITINVNKKKNSVTKGEYATVVSGAKWKLEFCYNSTCVETTPTKTPNTMGNVTIGDLNGSHVYSGKPEPKQVTVNIPDISAGSNICLRSAVYPASSGADTNWSDPEGDHKWAWSSRVCYKVAKKPSLEVWGGNNYLGGRVATAVSVKGNLANYNNFNLETLYGDKYVFGSWGENGIIAGGVVDGLSSGAGLGFALNNNGDLWPSYHPVNGAGNNANINGRAPGGSKYTSICNRSTETFANCSSGSTEVGKLGNSTSVNSANEDLSSIINKYAYGGEPNVSGLVKLNDESKIRERNVYYYYSGNEDLSINGETVDGTSTVRKGTVQVAQSNKDINIVGNLVYEDGYRDFAEMPKLVIYAKGNIKISCGVSRIDAILVAENSVKTCSDSNNINAQVNSNQLMVNGMIIARKLEAKRTYGAATGANSMIPAEIINFDSTLYLWGGNWNEITNEESMNMDVTYNKELSPRL